MDQSSVPSNTGKHEFELNFKIGRVVLSNDDSHTVTYQTSIPDRNGIIYDIKTTETVTATSRKFFLDIFITCRNQNLTLLHGHIHSKEPNGDLVLRKLLLHDQYFRTPRRRQLKKLEIPDAPITTTETWNFVFKGCVQFDTNSLKVLCSKLGDIPIYTRGLFIDFEKERDIVLQVGERKFPVHKDILVQRSRVFEAMFNSDTKENQEGVIVIQDLDEDVVEEMIHFMYTDDVSPKIKELSRGLLAAADKYFLDKLKILCEIQLMKEIDCNNACEIASIADFYGASELATFATTYIIENFDRVKSSCGWVGIQQIPKKVFVAVMKTVCNVQYSTVNNT